MARSGRLPRFSSLQGGIVSDMDCSALEDLAPRGRIIAGARNVFARFGYGETSVGTVCQAAQVSTATLYSYFPGGKEELFCSVVEELGQVYVAKLSSIDAKHSGIELALLEVGRQFISFTYSLETVRLLRLAIAESARFPRLGAMIDDAYTTLIQRGVELISQSNETGEVHFPDPEKAATIFFSLLTGRTLLSALLLAQPVSSKKLTDLLEKAVKHTYRLARLPG